MKKIYTLALFMFSLTFSFAQLAGTWKLAPMAGAMAVGPSSSDLSWWSNSADDVTTRACLFDDEFLFFEDGTFENSQGADTWLEAWQGMDPEGCGAAVAPHDGSNAMTWADNGDGTFTITGMGGHVGLPKATNNGELTDPANAPASVTYNFVIDGNTLTAGLNFGGGYWQFTFERTATSTDEIVQDMFSVYPNPANTEIHINTTEELDMITIRDITGKVVVVQENPSHNETINVSDLARGLYIIESRQDNLISIQKLSIN